MEDIINIKRIENGYIIEINKWTVVEKIHVAHSPQDVINIVTEHLERERAH